MGIDWTSAAVLVLVTIAIVNRIKEEWKLPEGKTWIYTLLSFGIGAALYFIGVYAPVQVTVPLTIGLAASGIYDAYKKQ
jgi:fatty acid desaturase